MCERMVARRRGACEEECETNPKPKPKPNPSSADVAERGVASIGVCLLLQYLLQSCWGGAHRKPVLFIADEKKSGVQEVAGSMSFGKLNILHRAVAGLCACVSGVHTLPRVCSCPDIFVLARPRVRAERSSCARKREKVLKSRLQTP